jgi:uncharacterized protein (UPF0147 family)
MNDKGNEIITHLNRLVNDRSLPQQVRNKLRYTIQYIKELQDEVECYGDLDIMLEITDFD